MCSYKKIFLAFFILSIMEPSNVLALSYSERLEGKILLQVESHGEAWYVHKGKRHYMRDGASAYEIMRQLSLGIADSDLEKIPAATDAAAMKNALSTCTSNQLANRLKGRILLQVQHHGEAWYVDTEKCRRIYMRDGSAAYSIMRFLSLGITNSDLSRVVDVSGESGALSSTSSCINQENVGDISQWKLHENENYNFSFRYHPDWTVVPRYSDSPGQIRFQMINSASGISSEMLMVVSTGSHGTFKTNCEFSGFKAGRETGSAKTAGTETFQFVRAEDDVYLQIRALPEFMDEVLSSLKL